MKKQVLPKDLKKKFRRACKHAKGSKRGKVRHLFFLYTILISEYLRNYEDTTDSELDAAAKEFGLANWGGARARNQQAGAKNKNVIFNDDYADKGGSHWVAVNSKGITYDPLRHSGSKADIEQHPDTYLCGQYCLAFLLVTQFIPNSEKYI